MEKSQHPTSSIALGPGGQITDCELLERLERTPILKPRDSLKLGIYFSESPSPTNRYLGDALWDSGISRIVVSRPVRLAIWDTFEVDSSELLDQKWDSTHPDPQGKEDADNQSFVFARVSGIGMLFENFAEKMENQPSTSSTLAPIPMNCLIPKLPISKLPHLLLPKNSTAATIDARERRERSSALNCHFLRK